MRPEVMQFPISRLLSSLFILALSACSQVPDTATEEQQAALITAAEEGNLQRIDGLIAATNQVGVRDACQWTPLMKAALYGHTQVVQRLLAAGARPDLGDKGSYTALMLAASNNHEAVVRLLLDKGADPNHRETTHGWTALIWAAKRGHQATVKTLLAAGADPTIEDDKGYTAADWAREKQQSAVLQLLSGK
jgi:ankyrin repeat protein